MSLNLRVSSLCARCQQEADPAEMCQREMTWEDGGQGGVDEVSVCPACALKLDEAEQWEEYCADPFNRDYERARAGGWSD